MLRRAARERRRSPSADAAAIAVLANVHGHYDARVDLLVVGLQEFGVTRADFLGPVAAFVLPSDARCGLLAELGPRIPQEWYDALRMLGAA